MVASIMQDVKECYVTGSRRDLHRHHVYFGANRQKSEQWGCWVWLRQDYHNTSSRGVHFDRALDLRLKQETQRRFEKLHGREKFIDVFGRNYL